MAIESAQGLLPCFTKPRGLIKSWDRSIQDKISWAKSPRDISTAFFVQE